MIRAARIRALAFAALAALAPAALPPARALAAEPPRASLSARQASVAANEEGYWRFAVVIRNEGGLGLLGDSLVLAVQSEGAATPLVRRLLLPKTAEEMSAGDTLETELLVQASAARAKLEVRFHAHSREGVPVTARASLLAAGSVLEDRYPPVLVRVAGRDAELRRVPAEPGAENGAAALLLPGETLGPADLLVPAARLAQAGFAVVVAGAPGRGKSAGPVDATGSAARAAALAALDTLLAMPGVDASRVGAWGVSRGAALALALAAEKPAAFRAVAAQSAVYEGVAAKGVKAALLVLHGEKDAAAPVASARAYAEAARAAGAEVTTKFPPQGGHELPYVEAARFLRATLAGP